MLVMGACGMIYEYALSVMGNNLMGSSHEQLFVIMGIMMFAMGIGATIQQYVVGRLLDKFLFFELLLGLLGGVSTVVIFITFAYTASYYVVMYGFALIIGSLIGLEVPLLIRINNEYSASLRTNLSQILCMDYVGSLFGALLFAYVLLSRVALGEITFLLGCVNTLLAVLGTLYFWPLLRYRVPLLVGSVVTLSGLVYGYTQADRWMSIVEQRCYEHPITFRSTSVYQHLVLTQRKEDVRLYINGNLQFSSRDEAIYHDLLVHPAMLTAQNHERVLILGGGDGLALREVLKYPDVRHVTLVDIDPMVVRLASERPELIALNRAAFHDARVMTLTPAGIEPGAKITVTAPTKLAEEFIEQRRYEIADVHVVHVDADLFVRRLGLEPFDVVLIDFPDPNSLELAKLYSVEFYHMLRERLAPGAVLTVQSTSPYFARKTFLCIGETLRAAGFAALPYRQNVPNFNEWGWHLAAPLATEADLRERVANWGPLRVTTEHANKAVLKAAFAFPPRWLEKPADLRPNTKLRPVIFEYYQRSAY